MQSETYKVGQIDMNADFRDAIRENTSNIHWQELITSLEANLLRRMGATPDADLPRLKGKVEYIGELRNFFSEIFQK